jgi:cobalamin biosynthesis protein CobT
MSTIKPKLKLKKIKGSSHILHVDTNLVLKSLEEKIVIGKYVDDGVSLLGKEDVELCDEWNLPYDSDKLNNNDEEEGSGEGSGEEGGEEEESPQEVIENKEVEEDEQNEEEKEEEQNEVETELKKTEDEYVNISTAPNAKYILDITSQFSKDIHNHFDLVSQFYNDKITTFENKVSNLDIKYNQLLNKYETECKEHLNTKEELGKLKLKFEGIKSLFN